MTACVVCCETVTESKLARCGCGFEACTSCTKRYLLGTAEDPHCMSCRRGLPRDDLVGMLGHAFVTTAYKKHRENVLFDRERAMLPSTQDRLANYRLCESTKADLNDDIRFLGILRAQIQSMTTTIRNKKRLIKTLTTSKWATSTTATEDNVACACPVDDCPGFVKTSTYVCGVCDVEVCRECHVARRDGHACDPNDVQTVALISSDTKPCPKCNVPIFKVSGCYQMFCTLCHCVFDWKNGRELHTKNIHNPHYVEWRNAMVGRGEADGDASKIVNGLRTHLPDTEFTKIRGPFQWSEFVGFRVLDNLPDPDVPADHLELRLRLLDKQITESEFKTLLQRRDKQRTRDLEVRRVYIEAMAGIQKSICDLGGVWDGDMFAAGDTDVLLFEIQKLRNEFEARLNELSKTYKTKVAIPPWW